LRRKERRHGALGAELIEVGHDFDAAREAAAEIARERGLDFIAVRRSVTGVSTTPTNVQAAGELDAVYVPIGMARHFRKLPRAHAGPQVVIGVVRARIVMRCHWWRQACDNHEGVSLPMAWQYASQRQRSASFSTVLTIS
jgi:hypothetical protein